VVLVLAGVAFFVAVRWRPQPLEQAPAGQVFCGPDGRLTSKQPIQSHRSYCILLRSDLNALKPNTPFRLVFSIIDDRGERLRRFATVHEKQMHLIVVRRDLDNFQHLHPTFNETTREFTLDSVTFPSNGPYRVFADFTPAEGQIGPSGELLGATPWMDMTVGDTTGFRMQALGAAELRQEIGEYTVGLRTPKRPSAGDEAMLRFVIERGGQPVTDLEPYLGALGHAVVLREGDLEFLHAHAVEQKASSQTGEIDIAVHFRMPGRYKAFVQFQHKRRVLTAAFVLPTVEEGSEEAAQPHGGAH